MFYKILWVTSKIYMLVFKYYLQENFALVKFYLFHRLSTANPEKLHKGIRNFHKVVLGYFGNLPTISARKIQKKFKNENLKSCIRTAIRLLKCFSQFHQIHWRIFSLLLTSQCFVSIFCKFFASFSNLELFEHRGKFGFIFLNVFRNFEHFSLFLLQKKLGFLNNIQVYWTNCFCFSKVQPFLT